jgi:hypothetical protein
MSAHPEKSAHTLAAVAADRRATPRVQVLSCVQGENGIGDSVKLINISQGGAMVHGNFVAAKGEVHEFRFTGADDDAPLVFAARVVHVLPVSTHKETTYALGLEFVTTTDHQRESIRTLIEKGICLLG